MEMDGKSQPTQRSVVGSMRGGYQERALRVLIAIGLCLLCIFWVFQFVTWNYETSIVTSNVKLAPPHCFYVDLSFPAEAVLDFSGDAWRSDYSTLRLLENGKPLGPGHAPFVYVRDQGGGSYVHWGKTLFFSTSDNSDPRENGRLYTLAYPISLRPYLLVFVPVCFVLLLLWWRFVRFRELFQAPPAGGLSGFVARNFALLVSGLIVVIPSLISIMPSLIFYFLPIMTGDSFAYASIPYQISQGHLPYLWAAPGYTVFAGIVLGVSGRIAAIVILQLLCMFASSLFLLYAVHRAFGWVCIPAGIAIAGFLTCSCSVVNAFSFMTESLYSSLLVTAIGVLVRGIQTKRLFYYFLLASIIGMITFVRPAGLFLLVSLLMLMAFLASNGRPLRQVLAIPLPALTVLAMVMSYNYILIGQPAVSPMHLWAPLGSTSLFWKEDPTLSAITNEAIQSFQKLIPPEDRRLVATSWDCDRLNDVYSRHFNPAILHMRKRLGASQAYNPLGVPSPEAIERITAECTKMVVIAISNDPQAYAKFILTNLRCWFFKSMNSEQDCDVYMTLRATYRWLYIDPRVKEPTEHYSRRELYDAISHVLYEYDQLPYLPYYYLVSGGSATDVRLITTNIQRLHLALLEVNRLVFRNQLWVYAFLAVFVFSCVQWIRSRFRSERYFVLVFCTTIPVGAALVASMGCHSTIRYSFCTEFIYYLSVALVPILHGPWAPNNHAGCITTRSACGDDPQNHSK
jgi:hypothetical protein